MVILDSSHTYTIESQVEFLKSSLSSRKDRTHLFALYHFPAYGIMKGGLNSPISKSMRKHWVPLFDEFSLDAAFENDHHVYKRSKLMKGDKTDPAGTLYIGDGAWGVNTRKPGAKEYWYVEKFEPTRHVIEVEIKDNVSIYRAINHDKKVLTSSLTSAMRRKNLINCSIFSRFVHRGNNLRSLKIVDCLRFNV